MKIFKRYLPDALIILGVAFTMYWFLEPPSKVGLLKLPSVTSTDYHTDLKVLGLVIVLLGVDIAVRRIYSIYSGKEK